MSNIRSQGEFKQQPWKLDKMIPSLGKTLITKEAQNGVTHQGDDHGQNMHLRTIKKEGMKKLQVMRLHSSTTAAK